MQWLEETRPQLVPRYRQMYAKGASAPKDYRRWLAAKITPLITAHGLGRGREDPTTGAVRSSALGKPRETGHSLIAEELPTTSLGYRQPTLF